MDIDDRLGALRPRSGVELVDAALVLARRHYASALGAAAPMYLPYLLLEVAVFAHRPALFWLDVLAWYASATLAAGTAAHALAAAYHGRGIHARESLVHVARRAPALLAATMLKWAFLLGGLLALVVPGVFLLASFFAVVPVAVLEEPGVSRALRRSYDLSVGGRRRILAVLAAVTALLWVAELSAALVLDVVFGEGAILAARVLGTLVGALLAPLSGAALVLLYYDQRIRREGYDLEVLLPSPRAGAGDAVPAR